MSVIEVRNLSKDYRQHFWTPKRRVLNDVSFDVQSGEIFGFLGPNGSGKSTTIKILLEIIFPTGGYAKLFGKPVGDRNSKRRLGFLPENPYFYDYLTAKEFLQFHGRLLGLEVRHLSSRIGEVLDLVGMRGTSDIYLRHFSKGMLQRVGIAQALVHDPELVVFDEPMTGLDPVGRKEVRDLMIHLKERGKTVFFSTHILADVEMVCDRVAILNKGRLLKCGSLEQLVAVHTKSVDMVWKNASGDFVQHLTQMNARVNRSADFILAKLEPKGDESHEDFEARVYQVLNYGQGLGAKIHSLNPRKDSLEDVFMREVGTMESRV